MSSKGTLLVVEDNYDLRESLVEFLQEEGYAVTGVENGKLALESIAVNKPDLVITDLMMPVMSGFELIEAITGTIPIIVLSASVLKARLTSLQGIEGYLAKPFDIDDLTTMVEQALKNRPAQSGPGGAVTV